MKKVIPVKHGNPVNQSNTIYLSTADSEGNACSFIASNYAGESTSAATMISF
jgi:gamma-glutamyltranspeptidase/glutathione hydrolase